MARSISVLALAVLSGCALLPPLNRSRNLLSAEEHVRLGAYYEEGGMRAQAEQEYALAVKKDKKCVPALLAAGNLAFASGAYDHAAAFYRRALRQAPGHAGASNNLAMVYLARGEKLDAAERLAVAALGSAGAIKPYVLDTIANIHLRRGRYALAKKALEEAERQAPLDNRLLKKQLVETRRELAAREAPLERRLPH